METLIEIKKLKKMFGHFIAVDDISFNVSKGEVLGFLGPNGAGKSTTMKMVTGFLAPTSGTAIVKGYDILREPMKVKECIGYLPEGAPAYPDMTPYNFLRFIAQVRGLKGNEAKKRIDRVVEQVSLESHLHQPIETLSKGFKRRVGLAQAILHDPEILIMDEPTDGLDPNQKHEVRTLIAEMAKDKAIVLSTHILEEVDAVCTRAVIIAAGQLIADGTPAELQGRSSHHNCIDLKISNSKSAAEKIKSKPFVEKVETISNNQNSVSFRIYPKNGKNIAAEIGELASTEGWKIEELNIEKGKLDEVFRTLTEQATITAGRQM